MGRVRRLVVPFLAVAVLAGCGGSRHARTTTAVHPVADPRADVADTWTAFFDTPAAQASLLQRSGEFGAQLAALDQSVLARRLTVQVERVVVHGRTANVTYTLLVDRKPILAHATGTAVRVGGRWRVGVASFCRLLALAGSTPPQCG